MRNSIGYSFFVKFWRDTDIEASLMSRWLTVFLIAMLQKKGNTGHLRITWDNYPRYVMTTYELIQQKNGIKHANIMEFMLFSFCCFVMNAVSPAYPTAG